MIVALLNQKGGVGKTTPEREPGLKPRTRRLAGVADRRRPPGQFARLGRGSRGAADDLGGRLPSTDHPQRVGSDRPGLRSCRHRRTASCDRAGAIGDHGGGCGAGPCPSLRLTTSGPRTRWSSLSSKASVFKESLKATFVVNRKVAKTAIGRDVVEALAAYQIPTMTAQIVQRVVFAEAAATGRAVFEIDGKSAAAAEIEAVRAELMELVA